MFATEFVLTPNNIRVFARATTGRVSVRRGNIFAFEGDDPIDFEDADSTLHFFFPKDYAWAVNDTATNFAGRISVKRYFYSDRGKDYVLIGVPWNWINQAQIGTLIIDPTTTVGTSDDVWLEDTFNYDGHSAGLLIGKAADPYPKKRTIIKFDVAGYGIPSGATVLNAQLKMYYYSASNGGSGSWVDRWVQAHQILVSWNEAQASSVNRLSSTPWNVAYVGLNDIDAKSTMESTVFFQLGQTGTWKVWNLTNLTQKWVNLTATNYGVVLWATNETTNGYDLRFRSSENTPTNERPYLEVTYSTEAKTVYFLKDHLGSVRATVLDSASRPVRGYDDYDPWGYPLVGRTKKTPYDSLQKIAKNKFTGQVWDDDYGLNWYHLGARPYDSQIGRIPVVDRFADKYPSLTPYHYAANNPVLFIDANGDTIDYSALNKEQRKSFDQLIVTLSKDKRFAEVWNTLATSTGIYKIAVNESQRLGGQYNRNTEATGSGGTLSFKSIEPSGIENITAHEIYHAYQHDQKNPPLSVGREIEASLFADAVTYDITGFAATMYPGRIPIFEQSYLNLLGGRSFNENDWTMAITTFKKGGLMIPEYKRLNTQPYNPLIKRFYPLIGR